MGCGKSKLSPANTTVLGVIQIMVGIYHVLMWYFLLLLYMGQVKGVFGTYEPLTYKTGTALWGIIFVLSGALTVKSAKYQTGCMLTSALALNILCVIVTILAAGMTIAELATFHSVSYRNYGQAKLGREVSRILLFSYPLEFGIALTYSICGCSNLEKNLSYCVQTNMPENDIFIRKELRILGAIQLMNSLFMQSLGYLWLYLYLAQNLVFGHKSGYMPIVVVSRYFTWATIWFFMSGFCSVLLRKKTSHFLMFCSLLTNIISVCIAALGLFLLSMELTLTSNLKTSLWQHRTGRMLSQYMFIFVLLEIFVASVATEWIYKAN